VSVVIPCYNQGHLLSFAIESALSQTAPPDEVIVVNDGSDDDTASVCHIYEGSVTYVSQKNAGLSAARHTGILRANTEYVHFLDADDFLRPTALAHLLEAARANPSAAVVRGSWEEITEDGAVLATVTATDLGADAFHALFNPLTVGPPCRYLVRRQALVAAGLFDTELRSCEDWDMWFRIALAGHHFVTARGAVAVYRRHPQSMSRNHKRMWESGTRVLHQAQARHACPLCSRRHRTGIRIWREYCYLSILRADIRAAMQQRRFGLGVAMAARALMYDPLLIGKLAASVGRSLSRSGPNHFAGTNQ
jgi:glycosyltransferase involved in cell wall biosynthesis